VDDIGATALHHGPSQRNQKSGPHVADLLLRIDVAAYDFPLKSGEEDDPAVLLDLDYWVLVPR
jgi:hypothetical protein